jgi:hypothetical protein
MSQETFGTPLGRHYSRRQFLAKTAKASGCERKPRLLNRGFKSMLKSKSCSPRHSDAIPKDKSQKWLSKKCRFSSKKMQATCPLWHREYCRRFIRLWHRLLFSGSQPITSVLRICANLSGRSWPHCGHAESSSRRFFYTHAAFKTPAEAE